MAHDHSTPELGSSEQLREKLLEHALAHGLDEHDANDACQDFFVEKYDGVVSRYRPGKRSLEDWVLFNFGFHCNGHAQQLWTEGGRNESLAEDSLSHIGLSLSLDDEAREERMQKEHHLGVLEELINTCLTGKQQALLDAFYFEGRSLRELAHQLDTTENAVKMRLFRIRQRLRSEFNELRASGSVEE